MKVILDTNIYISYLLARPPGQVITNVVETCLISSDIELIFPQDLRAELAATINGKEYLRTHIKLTNIESLLQALTSVATIPTPLEKWLALSRDPKDDYLLAYGLLEEVDYLVTGDKDLLVLKQIDSLKIVSAPFFWQTICGGRKS